MKRLVVASGILVLVAFGVSLARQSPAPDAHGASLLLITIDTLRADRVGAYGGPPGLTPAIDRVAAAGVVFDEALTSVPLTLPSHATIMSGLDPFHHGARNNGGRLAQTYETLATRLKAAGYATGAFVAAAVLDHRFGLSRGFDVYDDAIARAARGRSTLESERPCGVVVSRAARWIEKQTGPLFAWVHIYEPHAPYTPPDDLAGAHPGKPYDAEVAAADRCVNELLEGIAKFTPRQWLTVVMSDHGEGLGEHGERTHGLFVYQSTLRVPLVMAGPGLTRGERRRGIARTADVTPTLLALLGASAIPGLDGIDLFGPLTRSESYAETDYPTGFGWTGLRSWRAGGLKLINGPRPELFDVARDPREGRNLATERGADVTRLQRILRLALSAEVKADIRPVSAEVEERLRSLGYVSGRLRRPRPDPRRIRRRSWRSFRSSNARWKRRGRATSRSRRRRCGNWSRPNPPISRSSDLSLHCCAAPGRATRRSGS